MAKQIFKWPKYLKHVVSHYCPGCGHGIIHRLVAEVIEELDIGEKTIGVPPAGCAVLAYNYLDVDMAEAAHGRATAVATGIKRVLPDRIVFAYQGDGDIAAIGTAETVHSANRGENITCIFVNNGVYGMTGGQMAPTTLVGQSSTTTPGGRDMNRDGGPLDLSEMLALTSGSVYIERTAVNSPKNVRRTKKAITKAFKSQMANQGFTLVEILSPCPTNWKMSPVDSHRWIEGVAASVFPLRVIKDETGES
jgi:2-oxoglutarate ferredoxin oxidoreductase subunit beta